LDSRGALEVVVGEEDLAAGVGGDAAELGRLLQHGDLLAGVVGDDGRGEAAEAGSDGHDVDGEVPLLEEAHVASSQRALKSGLRFSRKARGPSLASSVERMGQPMESSFSSASRSERPSVSCTDRLMACTARGPFWAICSATFFASASACPSGTTRPTSPMRRASAAEKVLPVRR